ncbi:hypothetical protein [Rhizobium laguerreae]|uniref:Right-handed parallel beta-helix repeat-containing protein n=1 Tax=Rhizobium laguerreae TaxID=1076926 RepID=A0A7Y2RBL9_9HYPH|nr:hypothetical protein [Rhizobium laguerreae]NNH67995.1 hypothetical protein [Rhizobium laguerreae]
MSGSYRLADDPLFTGGCLATDAAVFEALFNTVVAAGGGEIILPGGDIVLEQTVFLKNPSPSPKVRIVGLGAGCTRFLNSAGTQAMFWVGDDTDATYTRYITFEGFSLATTVAQTDNDAGFFLRNTSDITFKDVFADGFRNGWSFGVGAPSTNNSVYSHLHNCGGNSSGPCTVAMIRLGSGGILTIDGGAHRWNASGGHQFLRQDNVSWNWDGLYVYGQFFEHFSKYLVAVGKGLVNVDWAGGQMDRADIFFQAEASAGGSNRGWKIHDNDILGFPCTFDGNGVPIKNGAIGILTGVGQSSDPRAIENIMVTNNRFDGLSDVCIYAANGEILATENTMVNCANWGGGAPCGGALIRLGQGRAKIQGNTGYRPNNPYGESYRVGVRCDGPAHPRRKVDADNDWYDYGDRPVLGTP